MFKRVVGCFGGRLENEVANFCGVFGCQGGDDVVKFVRCWVMPLVVNCASTCANQTCGSAGQKGGSLTFTAAMLVATVAAACGCACSSVIVSRRGHQCKYPAQVDLLNKLNNGTSTSYNRQQIARAD